MQREGPEIERYAAQHSERRADGSVLLFTLVTSVLLFGLVTALTTLMRDNERVTREAFEAHVALQMAENGLEIATYELQSDTDTDGDGVGSCSRVTAAGTINVTTTELVPQVLYQVDAVGVSGPVSQSLSKTVERVFTSTFPESSLSIVGNADTSSFEAGEASSLVFDKDGASEIYVTDANVSSAMEESLASKATDASLEAEVGTYASEIDQLSTFHDEMTQRILGATLLNARQVAIPDESGSVIELTEESGALTGLGEFLGESFSIVTAPAYHLYHETIPAGGAVRGEGILLVTGGLQIDEGATLEWNGDLIVSATFEESVRLAVNGGNLSVNGNILVLGNLDTAVDVNIGANSNVNVAGNFLVASDVGSVLQDSVRVHLEESSQMHIDGLMTMLGHQIMLSSDQGSLLQVDGMAQAAILSKGLEHEVAWALDGEAEFVLNRDKVRSGIASLIDLEGRMKADETQLLYMDDWETRSWVVR